MFTSHFHSNEIFLVWTWTVASKGNANLKIKSFKVKVSFDFVPLSVFTACAICLLGGFFFPGWDFPVTCPQLQGGGSFSLLSNIGIFHFPKLFLRATYSCWYGRDLVLFPSLKKRCATTSLSSLLPHVASLLLSAESNWKVTTVSPHGSPFSTATSFTTFHLAKPCPGPHLSSTLSSHLSFVFSCMTCYISVVIILPRHRPSYLGQLYPPSAALVVFHSCSASNSKWSSASPHQDQLLLPTWPILFWCHPFL